MARGAGRRRALSLGVCIAAAVSAIAWPAGAAPSRPPTLRAPAVSHPYNVFWDQNEEEDALQMPAGTMGQLVAPWDPNGQLCVVPDGSGRFVVGYNPTLASQDNPGSLKPSKQPPVGEAMYDVHGDFTGQTIYIPGPYALPGQTIGGDIPPDTAGGGAFNNNGTMTGCVFDRHANLFASDLGTAQGQFPPPDDGRLIEWFAPTYQTFCIVYGPTDGGVGPHHVDGTGGLAQPGDLALDPNTGDIMVPQAGSPNGGLGGQVLRLDRRSLPASAADCGPAGLYPRARLHVSTFVQGNANFLPFPQSIARDPTCDCWAVGTVIGNPSIVWLNDKGRRVGRSIPGEDIAHVGQYPKKWNPFGIAFAPDGTLYFVDIHIQCDAPLVNCGPGYKAGRLMRVTFDNGVAGVPTAIATGDDFPTSVTVCQTDAQICPQPGSTATVGPWDWPSYGHDAQHSFQGRTTLTSAELRSLKPAWLFKTHLAVSATPTVVDGVVYVGAWDGHFYALDLRSGSLRWKFQLDAQPAVSPQPGGPPDEGTDGGLVTSSAWFEPSDGTHPDLVIFGGGYTLYALDAHTGALYWKHAYTGRPDLAPDPLTDETRIFSSPTVVDGKVIFGVSPDGQANHRGYIAAADLLTGAEVWRVETDVATVGGDVLNDGCGGVWSSATSLPAEHLVVFDVSDCNFFKLGPYSEAVLALNESDGSVAWIYRPHRRDDGCDFDFGATTNAGLAADGSAAFLGVGGKDGTYYSIDPHTGALRWRTNVVFGGAAGGFIGTTAYDGSRVYGSTGIGDFGHGAVCDSSNPRDKEIQEPTVHVFDANTGAVVAQARRAASFGSTTVAGGMTFNCPAFDNYLRVRASDTGELLARVSMPNLCWSGVATVGDALVIALGASVSSDGGVVVLTPNGAPPQIPAS